MSTWAFENSRFDGPSLQPREFHQVVGVESGRKDGPLPNRVSVFGTHWAAANSAGKMVSGVCHRKIRSSLLVGQSDTAEALADREEPILPRNVVGSWKGALLP